MLNYNLYYFWNFKYVSLSFTLFLIYLGYQILLLINLKGEVMRHLSFISLFIFILFVSSTLFSQEKRVQASLHAKVSQTIGVETELTFDYSRPGVKGREIFGGLVPWGMEAGNKYSNEKPFPWRGGANKNTTLEVIKPVIIDGKNLPAGKYSIHFITGKDEWTVIINKANDKWGSYQYDESQDVFRFKVKPVEAPHKEWLEYGFEELNGTSCTAYLHWEKVKIPFKITVAE